MVEKEVDARHPCGSEMTPTQAVVSKRKLTAVCSHQTKIGNLDAHLI
ncbi:hypothetical protein EC80416_1232 [Escherichia coli 8.0416]|nr:hypothetical protein EC80416_1232 [Escherichia coli 8.0416]